MQTFLFIKVQGGKVEIKTVEAANQHEAATKLPKGKWMLVHGEVFENK